MGGATPASGTTDVCDVVVVGGGPVGVMTSLRAAQHGLSVAVCERSTEIYGLPRAIVLDDEGQRIVARAGLAAALAERSTPLRGAEFVDPDGGRLTGIELPDGVTGALGLPPVVAYEQPELERFLRAAAVAAGVDLRLGTAVDDLAPDDGGVRVHCAGGTTLWARWVVGADGASSGVRKQVGLNFDDQGFDQDWLVVDAWQDGDEPVLPALVQQICDPVRRVTFVPGHRGRRRWEFQLLPGESPDEITTPHRLRELLARWDPEGRLRIDRAVVYRFHALVAERFRNGPVFLAGDAAHQMPPFNGQGLCSGLRDAENLAWKLAAVAAGAAGDRLLDTYDLERRPHAVAQVAHAVDAGRLIDRLSDDPTVDPEAGYGGGRPFPHLVGGLLAGQHPLVGRPLPTPVVDGTWLLDHLGPGWNLVCGDDADPAIPDALARWSPTRTPPAVARALGPLVPSDTVVVVRPDLYVAAVTPTLDTVAGLLARLAG